MILVLVDRHGYFVDVLKADSAPAIGAELVGEEGHGYEVRSVTAEDGFAVIEVNYTGRT